MNEDYQYFSSVINRLLLQGPRQDLAPAQAALCGFLEGICLLDEALSFAAALPAAVSTDEDVYVIFEGQGKRPRCIQLGPVSRHIHACLNGRQLSLDDARCVLREWLVEHDMHDARPSGDSRSPLDRLPDAATAFWERHLPTMLLNDAICSLSITPIRPQALARLASGQPLLQADGLPTGLGLGLACSLLTQAELSSGASRVARQIETIMNPRDGSMAKARAQQLNQLQGLLDDALDDPIGSLLLVLAEGMCTRGTLKEPNPSHSITSRYTREIARMARAAPEVVAQVFHLEPKARSAAYEELLQHCGDLSDARAAISTLDMHLCNATGGEPATRLRGEAVPHTPSASKMLWPHEWASLIELCPRLGATPASQLVIKALVCAADERPFRPGDVISARMEDLEIYEDRVVLNLRRRANEKDAKTDAALGPTEFIASSAVAAWKALFKFREVRGATPSQPLWDRDKFEAKRTFTRACRAIDRAIKSITGDGYESFYSLRHSWFSHQTVQALSLDPAAANRALKRISAKGKHSNLSTTIRHYFHLPMGPNHRATWQALQGFITTEAVVTWSNLSHACVYQRVHRGRLDEKDGLAGLFMQSAPRASTVRKLTDCHRCTPDIAAPQPDRLSLQDVVACLLSIQSLDDAAPESGHAAIPNRLLSKFESRVAELRAKYSDQWSGPLREAPVQQPKLDSIVKTLGRPMAASIRSGAATLWRDTAQGGFLNCTAPAHLQGWLRFFANCEVPASRLLLRIDPSQRDRVEFLIATFESVYCCRPTIDLVPAGKGRPPVYLLLSSQAPRHDRCIPSAALNMVGFHTVLLATCIFCDLSAPEEVA
ncbi:hypothetical protein [Inhella proteolytica]|uniref:Tyr recombinase domain-containing protein n=1 Tax=Inhella proteolytica TaxID=2795029 RepID=A0A931J4J2_9BURK|nr:hypothetical protein [Inhella proteolytica]MBH9578141.1 hypothetical protein [Inhella proteolytica]